MLCVMRNFPSVVFNWSAETRSLKCFWHLKIHRFAKSVSSSSWSFRFAVSFIFSDFCRIVFILCACVGELAMLTVCVLVHLCWSEDSFLTWYGLPFTPARTVYPHRSFCYNLAWPEGNQNKWLLTLHSGTGIRQYLWESFPFGLQGMPFSSII